MAKTEYAGIDYGLGMANIDHSTHIRFGVIPAHAVDNWLDAAEAEYPACEEHGEDCDGDCMMDVEPTRHYDEEGYKIFEDSQGDLFIEKSPYYTYAQFCSPCAPGAAYLLNHMEPGTGPKAYALGHDWFEDKKAPYRVFKVEDDTELLA